MSTEKIPETAAEGQNGMISEKARIEILKKVAELEWLLTKLEKNGEIDHDIHRYMTNYNFEIYRKAIGEV